MKSVLPSTWDSCSCTENATNVSGRIGGTCMTCCWLYFWNGSCTRAGDIGEETLDCADLVASSDGLLENVLTCSFCVYVISESSGLFKLKDFAEKLEIDFCFLKLLVGTAAVH